MRFHVLGLGPVGSLISHHLRTALPASHSVTLIHKKRDGAAQIRDAGGTIKVEAQGVVSAASGFLSEVFQDAPFARKPYSDNQNQPIDSLFVATKAPSVLPALQQLRHRLSSNTTIVLLQNGMGIYEHLVDRLFRDVDGRPHFIMATNTHGTYLKSPAHVVHTGVGELGFAIVPDMDRKFEAGLYDETLPKYDRQLRLTDITIPTDPAFARYQSLRNTVTALLLLEPLQTTWKPMVQLQRDMRRKLVVNSIVNPLTAILGCRNGDLLDSKVFDRVAGKVCREASGIFAAELLAGYQGRTGLSDVNVHELGVDRLDPLLTAEALEAEVLRVVRVTKNNISSTLEDVRRGRATEIGFINGYLSRLAGELQVPATTIRTLQQLVQMRSDIPIDQIF